MDEISSILTSKGQITIPKTVREILGIDMGDRVVFSINLNGEIMLKKSKENLIPVYNLINVLINNNGLITVQGQAGTGKTTLMRDLLSSCYSTKKVAIIDFHKEIYNSVKEIMTDVQSFVINDFSIDKFPQDSQFDLIVVDEAGWLKDFNDTINFLRAKGNVIVVKQVFTEEERLNLGDHFTISANRSINGNIDEISEIKIRGSAYDVITIYKR